MVISSTEKPGTLKQPIRNSTTKLALQINYIDIFSTIEQTLKKQSGLSDKLFTDKYSNFFNLTFSSRTDDEYFYLLKLIVFYSGFKAETVTNKIHIINKHLPDYKTISFFDDKNTAVILSDKEMIKNRSKISATINNAKIFQNIVEKYGSFQKYLDSFEPKVSFEKLMLLKEELTYKFNYLGGITVYHFLTDIGLPVLKPDRVLTRIFERLGLIENEKQLLKTVIHGRKFAAETEKSIRYIDIIFVTYGQQGPEGICLSKNPKCHLCGLSNQCNHFQQIISKVS